MLKLSSQIIEISKRLINFNNYFCSYAPNAKIKHFSELTMRAARRQYLNRSILNKNTTVIQAEIRKPQDKVLELNKKLLCPGVIVPHNKNPDQEIDIVVKSREMRGKAKSQHYSRQKVKVRVEGNDYQCILKAVTIHPLDFVQKAIFQRYIPGQANELTVPLSYLNYDKNAYLNTSYKFTVNVKKIKILSYNYQYPTYFYIDLTYTNPQRPYVIGDVANTFPPGILLHPSEDPKKKIFQIIPGSQVTREQMEQNIKDHLQEAKKKADAKNKTGSSAGTPAGGAAGTAAGGKAGTAAGGKADGKGQPAAASKDSAKDSAKDASKKKKK